MPGSATNHKTPEAPPGATARLSFELRAEVLRSARVPDEGSSVDKPKPSKPKSQSPALQGLTFIVFECHLVSQASRWGTSTLGIPGQ